MKNLFIIDILMEKKNYLNKKKKFLLSQCQCVSNQSKIDEYSELLELVKEGLSFVNEEISFCSKTNDLLKDRIWYHRTSAKNYNEIIEKGFMLPKESSRFGKGIYFMNTDKNNYFGDKLLKCITSGNIISLWHEEIRFIFNEYNLQPEEEGITLLEEYVISNGFDAVEVKYLDGTSELVVYNKNIIKIIK